MIKYEIEATNINGNLAHDFIGRKFPSMKSALKAFDAKYSRKGFRIIIMGYNPDIHEEPIVSRIVKTSFVR